MVAELVVIAIRERRPTRSDVAHRTNYRNYKDELRADFNARCGYCDSLDGYFGGKSGAHIDHFAPQSKFPTLKSEYGNLVYSCPFCNRAKANKWFGDDAETPNDGREGFVDPCSEEFGNHLARLPSGEIVPTSRLGEYMIDHLKLQLMRHRFIWQAQRLDRLAKKMHALRPLVPKEGPIYQQLLEAIIKVIEKKKEYESRIHAE